MRIRTDAHAPLRLIGAYALGALGPAASRAVSVHVAGCPICSATLATYDAVGGVLLENETDDTNLSVTLADVWARLDQSELASPAYSDDVMRVPEILRDAYARALAQKHWSFAGAGLRTLDLDIPGSQAAGEVPQLLRIEPGYGAPRHGHGGVELTLVLTGAFKDETGVFRPGDLAVASPAMTHRPIALAGEVCLAYAVSHAPMRFTGFLGYLQRILTPRPQ